MGRAFPPIGRVSDADARFRLAAWTYFVYGVIYWVVAFYLELTVFPVRRGLLVWFVIGALVTVGVPWVLARRRPRFEQWALARRDFARVITILVAARALIIASLAAQGPEALRMPRFGGGVPPTAAGAWGMAVVAAVTAVILARAGWHDATASRSPLR